MNITALSGREATRRTLHALGLDETTTDLLSPEAICASLRRAASFLCPATPRELVDAVAEALGPLDDSSSIERGHLAEQLDLLLAIGDLVELPSRNDHTGRRLYIAPPSYAERAPGRYLLLGVRPNGVPLLDESVGAEVHHAGHMRSIELDVQTGAARLQGVGLHEIGLEDWRKQPRTQSTEAVVGWIRERLDGAAPSGPISNMTVLDAESSVLHYRRRWRTPAAGDRGDYIARRPQAYGADLWCLVRVEGGTPRALIELPTNDHAGPACDEAWRFQAAIDAARGRPQIMRVRPDGETSESRTLDLFGPVPGWAQRYLEIVGDPCPRAKDALISYRVPLWAIGKLAEFFTDMLWMQVKDEGGSA